jgi:hypothetical protein
MNRSPLASVFAVAALGALTPAAAQTPPPPALSFNSLRVVPSPAAAIVRGVLLRNLARFAACNPPSAPGTVSLRLATDANGQIASATSRGSTFAAPNAAVTGCVVAAARRLRFPGSVQGTLDIEVVVAFPTPDAGAPTP